MHIRGIKLSSFKLQDVCVEVSHPRIRGSTPTCSRVKRSMPARLSLVHTHRPRSMVQCSMFNACACSMVRHTVRAYGCRMNVQTLELVVVVSYNT
jgi:hypothetical protein